MASGYDGHTSKRQKMDEGGKGYNEQNIAPSKVVHIRGLPEYANEDDVVAAVRHFGQVDFVLPMPKRHQALVEFRDLSSSRACVNFANNNRLEIGTYQIFANFSTSTKITRTPESEGAFSSGPQGPHNILLFTVVNAQYPITVDVMHTICNPHGRVQKIVIFKKQFVQSMVQFDSTDAAKRAKEQLHGCDIYSGCCTLRIEYARATELNVKMNTSEMWDYTNPTMGKPGVGNSEKRNNPPLLADPRYTQAPTLYGEVDEFGGDGFGGVQQGPGGQGPGGQGPGGQGWGRGGGGAGVGGGPGGFQGQGGPGGFQGQGGPGFDGQYNVNTRGVGRGLMSPGGYQSQGRQPGSYGGQEGWNQEMPQQQRGFGQGGRQDGGFGGGFGQQGLMGQQAGYMEQQGAGVAGGAPVQGCVVMVYGLDPDKMNCDTVFNLFCLYGNVIRIKFLRSKEGAAMVQMGDNMAVERVMFNLNGVSAFGKKIAVTHSKQAFLQDVNNPHTLPDGSSSYKDFTGSRNNRFMTPESAAKNRILHPTEIVHYFNAPPNITEEEINKLFDDSGVTQPYKVLQFKGKSERSSSGLLEWERKSDGIEAILLMNHLSVPNQRGNPYILKLCFSQRNIRK